MIMVSKFPKAQLNQYNDLVHLVIRTRSIFCVCSTLSLGAKVDLKSWLQSCTELKSPKHTDIKLTDDSKWIIKDHRPRSSTTLANLDGSRLLPSTEPKLRMNPDVGFFFFFSTNTEC